MTDREKSRIEAMEMRFLTTVGNKTRRDRIRNRGPSSRPRKTWVKTELKRLCSSVKY